MTEIIIFLAAGTDPTKRKEEQSNQSIFQAGILWLNEQVSIFFFAENCTDYEFAKKRLSPQKLRRVDKILRRIEK